MGDRGDYQCGWGIHCTMMTNEYTLITGASSGIGRQIAITLSQTDNVILCGRNEDKLVETKRLCSREQSILIWRYDVSNINTIEADLKDFISSNQLFVSKYVHSAGVDGMKPLRSLDYDFVLNVYTVNVFAFIFIMKALSSKRINNPRIKSAVMISSNIAEMGAKAFITYTGSKAAANGVVRSMALELAPDVRVNSVSPGAITTDMTVAMQMEECVIERMKNTYPLGWGKTDYIADTVKFLLSDDASWITGQNIVVDGGRTINLNG